MSDEPNLKAPPRLIDADAKARFLAELRGGARREDAALAAGFHLTSFYGARRRDRAFAAEWAEALSAPPAAGRRASAYEERDARLARGEVRIAGANRRLYQRRRRRHVRFDEARQALFLTHFAGDCDTGAAAAAAGVSESTVHRHCRCDDAFAGAYREALWQGYANLEAELVRQRLAAQARLRAAIDAADFSAPLLAEQGAEFDRIMKVLARHDRKPRRVERGFSPGGRRQEWTFDRAMKLLEKKLRAIGAVPIRPSPPPPDNCGEGG